VHSFRRGNPPRHRWKDVSYFYLRANIVDRDVFLLPAVVVVADTDYSVDPVADVRNAAYAARPSFVDLARNASAYLEAA